MSTDAVWMACVEWLINRSKYFLLMIVVISSKLPPTTIDKNDANMKTSRYNTNHIRMGSGKSKCSIECCNLPTIQAAWKKGKNCHAWGALATT